MDLGKCRQHTPAITTPNSEARDSGSAKYCENMQNIKISKFHLKKKLKQKLDLHNEKVIYKPCFSGANVLINE